MKEKIRQSISEEPESTQDKTILQKPYQKNKYPGCPPR